jgi:2-polyprenyl-3-methyl-5-hydroxy-6-metoxy-1,4-benzoquinol methylase
MHSDNIKKQEVIDFYHNYTKRQIEHGINERHKSIISKAVKSGMKPFHSVLEIGCGVGTETKLLGEFLNKGKLYSYDIAPENIRIAKESLSGFRNVELDVADATKLILDEVFDVIIMPDVIEHIPLELHARMFQNMSKMLKPDGFIFIHIPNPEYLAWCHENRKEILQIIDQPIYTSELLNNLQGTNLTITSLETYSIWVEKGDYQFIVLRKKNTDFSKQVENRISIWEKIKYKLHGKNQ